VRPARRWDVAPAVRTPAKPSTDLLRQVSPGGPEAARQLQRLLGLKGSAHQGVITLSGEALKSALRGARNLVTFPAGVLRQ
jgi:hypothetical protein